MNIAVPILLAVLAYQTPPTGTDNSHQQQTKESQAKHNDEAASPDKSAALKQSDGAHPYKCDGGGETGKAADDSRHWTDYVNAVSTLVIAVFTVGLFIGVFQQIGTSRNIERAWILVDLKEGGSLVFDGSQEVSAYVKIIATNEGGSPAWVEQVQGRMILADNIEHLPAIPILSKNDVQGWYPPPIAGKSRAACDWNPTCKGRRESKVLIVYGKITYLDIFRKRRFSTFGYSIEYGSGTIDRLASHPEYNRNT